MSLPPDRGHLTTEQRHDHSTDLDRLPTIDAVALVVGDHGQVLEALTEARPALARFIDDVATRMRRGGRLIYVGAGTSGRLGVLDAAECPPTFHVAPECVIGVIAGGDAALRRSSEGLEDQPDGAHHALSTLALGTSDTVLGIAAGGTTPYVLGGIEFAKRVHAMTGLLTCVELTSPPPCDHLIHLPTGPELLTGSTRLKAGTATKIALNTITTLVFTQLGKVYGNLMVDLRATNDKLTDRAIRTLLMLCPDLDRAAAARVLDAADRRLPVAIVMERLGVDATTARARLDASDGRLRDALEGGEAESPSPSPSPSPDDQMIR